MTNITRRTALRGATAALAGASLAVAGSTLTSATALASEPVPLADVTTRLGAAMDEVSALLGEWDFNFRAIISADGECWLQNSRSHLPRTTEQLVEAWRDQRENLLDLNRRLIRARSQTSIDRLSNIRMTASHNENESRNAMLRSLIRDRRVTA